jgi:hypothetical protein
MKLVSNQSLTVLTSGAAKPALGGVMRDVWTGLLGNSTVLGFVLNIMIGGGAGFLAARHLRRQDELQSLRRMKRVEWIERQLSEFYLPLQYALEKDGAIWFRIPGLGPDRTRLLPDATRRDLERKTLFPNQSRAVEIIETKFHLARADANLGRELLAFVRHVAVFHALRDAGLTTNPISVGEPWPDKLLPLVRERTDRLQKEYEQLLTEITVPGPGSSSTTTSPPSAPEWAE